jgi:GNAT superfamily N-acetyltransferase
VSEWAFERLDRSHQRAGFASGKEPLDRFLTSLVSQYEKRRLGSTYVAVEPGQKRVMGYYTLAAGSVAFEELPASATKKLPHHPIPVALLARLAVDGTVQGRGLGGLLLADAVTRCLRLSEQLGLYAVTVDAIDESARGFYEKHGFVAMPDAPLRLYLPISMVEDGAAR